MDAWGAKLRIAQARLRCGAPADAIGFASSAARNPRTPHVSQHKHSTAHMTRR